MQQWLEVCKDEELISSNYELNQDPNFRWNTQEQAIMNLLIRKYIINGIFQNNFKYTIKNRIFDKNNLL